MNNTTFNDDRKMVEECIKVLATRYVLTNISKSQEVKILKVLSRFDSFKHYNDVYFIEGVQLTKNNNNSLLIVLSINSIIDKVSRHQVRRENVTEWEFIGLVNLNRDYGQVMIRPETLSDKINELVCKTEVDFSSDTEFSRKYFVLTTDENKLRANVSDHFLTAIKKNRSLEIEINGRNLIVRLKEPISLKTVNIIAEFLTDLNDGIN